MIPIYILAIEDESDREYMSSLYVQYHRLMYSTKYRITSSTLTTSSIFSPLLSYFKDAIRRSLSAFVMSVLALLKMFE